MSLKIHSTAIIEDGAVVGSDCVIGPYCHVGKDVRLGDGNILHSHVSLVGLTSIGAGNEFFPYACIGGRTEDMKFQRGSVTHVEIGNGNVFREYCTVNSATDDGATTRIADNSTFLSDSHVGHDCRIGSHVVLGCGSKLAGHVQIDDYTTVNGMTGVIQFVRLGKYSFIGAINKVTKDILPFMIAEGNPAVIRVVNTIGLERKGFDAERIRRIKSAMRELFKSPASLQSAAQVLADASPDDPDLREIASFVAGSQTGIAKLGA
ncbi:acyl-ACP--UDP-N-acetylglucosamine O-acyltransferase [Variovorax sp. NFACC27]|uniref:acyl-ACP--UDP-N-acetylglucosamine O-acyltransferase n=1 Tax=unclassified Variovorax TaxID=663243 RepID=UPI00089B0BD8|nr:acyl-ACP--UDP-N-acetylglucosamine O-acyltransferase [Variovorax sp. YR750]SEF27499.1 acyl-[acyl-carrier-protein]--UDP-N-acetylglucosamine O-acyltransferase [Variovorax sp. NFACC28]SEG74146.1 acyl-[acyl-carrier-protein]--UDP-N-acetylglucosamine O-acyltransferase [Variovorax sp. NFACC29]SFC74164.1 acyl-[acyl-carrier-protein]--UDP-N-acetylglucosamine O-acyltransferase [Variovorax sp. NFACC26]SFG02653.1 acyl-[acyl-carrier-protein]--UDP-N-acetylglucosamine O-acyltransferase [Variovorax sp. NFACC2